MATQNIPFQRSVHHEQRIFACNDQAHEFFPSKLHTIQESGGRISVISQCRAQWHHKSQAPGHQKPTGRMIP